LERAEMKHKAHELRLVYKLHKHNNYDDDGVATDKLQRSVLTSSGIANPACSYAIGTIHKGQMIITPLKEIKQMRPDFSHIDRLRQKKTGNDAPVERPAEADAAASSGEEDAQPVQEPVAVPVRQQIIAAARQKGKGGGVKGAAEDLSQMEPEEPWTRLDHYSFASRESQDIKRDQFRGPAIAAANGEEDHPKLRKLELDGDPESYLATMCEQMGSKRRERTAPKKKQDPADGPDHYTLGRMPMAKQVEAVVRHLLVCSFTELKQRLPSQTQRQGDLEIVQLLRRCAALVGGNWVVMSTIAGYDENDANARDILLMLLFKKGGILQPNEYASWDMLFKNTTQKFARDDITRGVLVQDKGTGIWVLKRKVDKEFIQRFPEIQAEYVQYWDEQKARIMNAQKTQESKGMGKGGKESQVARKNAFLGTEVQRSLTAGGMSAQELRLDIQKRITDKAITDDMILQTLQSPAIEVTKVRHIYLLAATGVAANDAFRDTVFDMFRERDRVTKEDIREEYERRKGSACSLTDYVMRSLIREVAERDRHEKDTWILKGV